MKLTQVRSAMAQLMASTVLLTTTLASAQEPAQNIDSARHGNLSAAQSLVRDAYDKVTAAQVANNDRLDGHAARAKELMRGANDEIKLAAIAANRGVAPTLPLSSAPPAVSYVAPAYAVPGPDWRWGYHARYGWGWHHTTWGWHRGWY